MRIREKENMLPIALVRRFREAKYAYYVDGVDGVDEVDEPRQSDLKLTKRSTRQPRSALAASRSMPMTSGRSRAQKARSTNERQNGEKQ